MPMTAAGLSAAIKAALGTHSGFGSTRDTAGPAQQFCDDLASAIVSYIQGNATVSPVLGPGGPGLVAPPSGGPVTGAGSIL
jgi:hypothetical protein